MTRAWNHPDAPSPEQLSAFADGELQARERERIERWLAEHPEAAAEVEGALRFMHLWEATAPATPSAPVWDQTLARIEAAVSTPRQPGGRRPWNGPAAVAAIAAAVILALLTRPLWDPFPPSIPPGEELPFPVTSTQDITILSMDARDADNLVVGHPPVLGPIELAEHGDVRLVGDTEIRLGGWSAPMIVDPLAVPGQR